MQSHVEGGSSLAGAAASPGDFNSDKSIDMVVLKHDKKMVAVLLATKQKVVSSGDDPPLIVARPDSSLECNAPEGDIVSHQKEKQSDDSVGDMG